MSHCEGQEIVYFQPKQVKWVDAVRWKPWECFLKRKFDKEYLLNSVNAVLELKLKL